jgi:hypothetical protein
MVTPKPSLGACRRHRRPCGGLRIANACFRATDDPPQDYAPPKEVPTLREFASRFLDGHARANRQKPNGVAAKEMILRVHLMPALGHLRCVPLTIRLAAVFRDHRHLRSANVLCQDEGQSRTRQMVQYSVLRASPRAIQELTGHRELRMTQRYMHLSPRRSTRRFACWISGWPYRVLETSSWTRGGSPKERSMDRTT